MNDASQMVICRTCWVLADFEAKAITTHKHLRTAVALAVVMFSCVMIEGGFWEPTEIPLGIPLQNEIQSH